MTAAIPLAGWRLIGAGLLLAWSLLGVSHAHASSRIEVQGLMPGIAILVIDGENKMLREGASHRGVTLISADSRVAVLEVEGERLELGLSQRVGTNYQAPAVQTVTIRRDSRLQYQTTANINGRSVLVLVDTGANIVAMNESHARRVGVDLDSATPSRIETASGLANAWVVNLRSVDVGGITVNNVQASVIEGQFPGTILLGMTYLRHVKIEETQGVMTLSR